MGLSDSYLPIGEPIVAGRASSTTAACREDLNASGLVAVLRLLLLFGEVAGLNLSMVLYAVHEGVCVLR